VGRLFSSCPTSREAIGEMLASIVDTGRAPKVRGAASAGALSIGVEARSPPSAEGVIYGHPDRVPVNEIVLWLADRDESDPRASTACDAACART
jgi:hypothetical protein